MTIKPESHKHHDALIYIPFYLIIIIIIIHLFNLILLNLLLSCECIFIYNSILVIYLFICFLPAYLLECTFYLVFTVDPSFEQVAYTE